MGVLVKRKAVAKFDMSKVKSDAQIVSEMQAEKDKERKANKVNWDQYLPKDYKPNSSRKEVDEMKVKSKVKVIHKEAVAKKEAGKKETIDDIWVKTLSAAVGKNLTDKAIAQQMEKACPGHKYTEASVAAHRSGYNNGRFPIQKGAKPKVRLEKYEDKKKK